ncbi:DUF1566 domain-containing protein [Chromobacterium violaceum]|uniref:DUF1566 domain-containing protein n=1 Tax=Chromobacterium violaceum TaxID=536 RepID=UPI001B34507D|nr:DUF1566 domain-containing protein [Chromobacterium violaceum]MBP4048991.1 DUF1566 domain-containing protein [Chromobacterium violaceum]
MQQGTIQLAIGKAMLHAPADEAARVLIEHFTRPDSKPAITLPKIGEPWPEQGGVYAGLMRGENGQPDYHLIVAADPAAYLEEIAWGGYGEDEPGAKSEFDGLANTQALVASEQSHPVAEWAAALTIDGHQDLYLPARRELRLCWVNVPELFKDGWHWSSTQASPCHAWFQAFGDGLQGTHRKNDELRARAVRRFVNLPL